MELAAKYGLHIEATYVWIWILIIDLLSFRYQACKRHCKPCNVINKYRILTSAHTGGSCAVLAIVESDPITANDFWRTIQGLPIDGCLLKKEVSETRITEDGDEGERRSLLKQSHSHVDIGKLLQGLVSELQRGNGICSNNENTRITTDQPSREQVSTLLHTLRLYHLARLGLYRHFPSAKPSNVAKW